MRAVSTTQLKVKAHSNPSSAAIQGLRCCAFNLSPSQTLLLDLESGNSQPWGSHTLTIKKKNSKDMRKTRSSHIYCSCKESFPYYNFVQIKGFCLFLKDHQLPVNRWYTHVRFYYGKQSNWFYNKIKQNISKVINH